MKTINFVLGFFGYKVICCPYCGSFDVVAKGGCKYYCKDCDRHFNL